MPTGRIIKINGLSLYAPIKLQCNKSINALIKPQPGHSIWKIDFHKQGIKISIEKIVFSKIDTMKKKATILKSLFAIIYFFKKYILNYSL